MVKETFIYKFGLDDKEFKDFILNNFGKSNNNLSKVQIGKNNLVNIYYLKWLSSVKNSISVDCDMFKAVDKNMTISDIKIIEKIKY